MPNTNPYYLPNRFDINAISPPPVGAPGQAAMPMHKVLHPSVSGINPVAGAGLAGAGIGLIGSTLGAFQVPEGYKISSGGYSGNNITYDLGDDFAAIRGYGEKQVSTTGRALSTAGSYAKAGAQIGTLAGGPIGTLIGGIGGGLIGGIVGLFGGRRAKRKAEEKKMRAYQKLLARQEAFNVANVNQAERRQQEALAIRSFI
jgi:hypothetical protein